jgi:8-oxo-dGTP diphosphatase
MFMPKSDQGIDHEDYRVVPRTLIFLFNDQNQVLLLKGSPTKRLWADRYNGIGGHIDRGEDILEAAYRELCEETGISDASIYFCGQIMVDVSKELGVGIFLFRGDYDHLTSRPSAEGSLAWVDLDQLDAYSLVEDLPVLIPMVAAHRPLSPMIIGKYTYGEDGQLEISIRRDA